MPSKVLISPEQFNLIEATLGDIELALVEVKRKGDDKAPLLCIVIADARQPVGHEQCTIATKALRQLPELHEYALEVWSPGIDRELKTERDFQVFRGYRVEISGDQMAIGYLIHYEPNDRLLQLCPYQGRQEPLQEYQLSLGDKIKLAAAENPINPINDLTLEI